LLLSVLGWCVPELEAVTRAGYDMDSFKKAAERIWNLERFFNLKAGLTAADDTLPKRLLEEPFATFYMKALVPKDILMLDIWRSVIPFVGLQLIGLILVMVFPQIALWLPNILFK